MSQIYVEGLLLNIQQINRYTPHTDRHPHTHMYVEVDRHESKNTYLCP